MGTRVRVTKERWLMRNWMVLSEIGIEDREREKIISFCVENFLNKFFFPMKRFFGLCWFTNYFLRGGSWKTSINFIFSHFPRRYLSRNGKLKQLEFYLDTWLRYDIFSVYRKKKRSIAQLRGCGVQIGNLNSLGVTSICNFSKIGSSRWNARM